MKETRNWPRGQDSLPWQHPLLFRENVTNEAKVNQRNAPNEANLGELTAPNEARLNEWTAPNEASTFRELEVIDIP